MDVLLKLKNVNLKYQTGNDIIKVLKNINLETKKNESISIVGESGSGKTSLIMLAGGLEKVTSGKIFFEDQEISKMSEDEVSKIRRKNIGIVFQSFYLIPNYTAVENVALTLELNNLKNPNERAKELLDSFWLYTFCGKTHGITQSHSTPTPNNLVLNIHSMRVGTCSVLSRSVLSRILRVVATFVSNLY